MKLIIAFLISGVVYASPYNCKVTTQSDFVISTVSTSVLAAKQFRRCLIIQNRSGSQALFVKFGAAHVASEGLTVGQSTIWIPTTIPSDSVYLKGISGSTPVTVIEGE